MKKRKKEKKKRRLMPKECDVLEISAHKRASQGGCLFQECLTFEGNM